MLLGKHKKQSVWLYDNVLLFLECACHTSHTCPDLNRPRSTTCGTKGCMKNCFGLAGETVPGSTTTVWRALSTLSTVLCLCGMKLKRSISTRSLPSKAPQNSSPQKCFFHTGPANPGYLASSSVDPGKGLKCVQCVGHASSSHTRDLYILRFLHLLRLLISSASKLSGLANRHRETSHFLEGSSVTQLPHKMLMLQHCLCLVHAGLYSRCCFACC